jgi:N-methylhydantoinase A
MRLDAEAASTGIKTKIADPLGISPAEAAWGIHLVATSNMENALRIVSVERGRDPRRYAMVAFGGAGPLHAARLARAVGIPTVIVPSGAGVGSAIGLLEADPRIDVTTTKVLRLHPERSTADIATVYKGLEAQALADAKRMAANGELQWARYAQMRYAGQGFEIHVDLPDGAIDDSYGRRTIEAFNEAYLRKHKFLDVEGTIEAVDWTLVAAMPARSGATRLGQIEAAGPSKRSGMRKAWFPEAGGYVDTRILDRQALTGGATVTGPAILEDLDSTTVMLPGDVARLSAEGHLIIDIAKEGTP